MISIQTMWRNHIQEHRNLFILILLGVLLLEIELFAMAAVKSGRETRLQISDAQGRIVYSVKGLHLEAHQKADFERTFGPLAAYHIEVKTEERPFPLRPWLAAAVGLPVGAVLLLGFFAKAYEVLFLRSPAHDAAHGPAEPAGRLGRVLWRISRLNVFIVGGMVFMLAFGIWALPQLLSELGRYGVTTIARYKWAVLGAAAVFLGLVIWIVYLRYLLARKSIEGRIEVEKYRLQLEVAARPALNTQRVPLLENRCDLPPAGGAARSENESEAPGSRN